MSLNEYKRLDLTLMLVLAFVAEIMGQYLHIKLPGAGFYLSFSMMITIIAMLRWGVVGGIVSISTVVATLIFTPELRVSIVVIHLLSYSSVMLIPIIFRKRSVYEIVSTTWRFMLYIVTTFGIVMVVYSIVASLMGYPFLEILVLIFSRQLFSLLMSYIVLLIIRHQKELLVDMTIYFNEDKETKK